MPLPKDLATRLAQQNLQRIDPAIGGTPSRGNVTVDPVPPKRSFKIPPTNDRPVLVQSSIIIPANSSSPGESVNLINPNGEAMEVHEIKFGVQAFNQDLSAADYANGLYAHGLMTGGQVAVEMQLGSNPLTNGQVPIWNFGLARFLDVEGVAAYPLGAGDRLDSFYTWTLKHPLYIPAGVALSVSAKSLGLVPQASVVTVALSGVTVADTQRDSMILPYISHWESPPFKMDERNAVQSSPTDLINMFDQDLWIERFMCRLAATYLPRGLVEIGGVAQPDVVDGGTAVFDANDVLTATMKGSNGAVIVRDPTPLRALFGSRNRAWQVSARLPPQEFIRVMLSKIPVPSGYRAINAPEHLAQAFVSMIGWRTVQL